MEEKGKPVTLTARDKEQILSAIASILDRLKVKVFVYRQKEENDNNN